MELHFPDNARINTYDFKESILFRIYLSFVVGIGFGKMIDAHDAWLALLPNTMALNTVFALDF